MTPLEFLAWLLVGALGACVATAVLTIVAACVLAVRDYSRESRQERKAHTHE